MIAVQGPNARAKVWAALPGSEGGVERAEAVFGHDDEVRMGRGIHRPHRLHRRGWLRDRARRRRTWRHCGTRLSPPASVPAGLGARDTLRLEAGMNLYGQDMDERVTPLESGLAWTVDLASPRDFVGKAALLAHPPQRQLAGLVLTDKGGVLRAHQAVRTAHGDGEITSGTFSPTLNRSIALARLPLARDARRHRHRHVRDKALAARVVKPPFARNGKILVG